MANYEYLCDPKNGGCKHRFETFQSMKATPLRKCPKCGKLKLVRQIGSVGLIFNGSDWTPKYYGESN